MPETLGLGLTLSENQAAVLSPESHLEPLPLQSPYQCEAYSMVRVRHSCDLFAAGDIRNFEHGRVLAGGFV